MSNRSKERRSKSVATWALMFMLTAFASASAEVLPAPPRIPQAFQWKGRYIVRDLGVDVPFSWYGSDGNMQMIAGSLADRIYFTNILSNGKLYTLTYIWPRTASPDTAECVCLGNLTLNALNACLASSRYVGPEAFLDPRVRLANHFRISVVLGDSILKPGAFRFPIMHGDFYVDRANSTKIRKVLHFGFQNLLDPALDEWIVLRDLRSTPGRVALPSECRSVKCPNQDVFGSGFFCR